jgi:prevent-host-death family protein
VTLSSAAVRLPGEHRFVLGPNEKGDIAEVEIARAAIRAGCTVSRPMADHPPYDLVIEVNGRLLRVQCKWAALKGGVVQVRLRRCAHSPTRGYVRGGYDADEIDAIAAYCEELGECFLVPMELVAGQDWLSIRVETPRNGQRASIHSAAEHTLAGAIAQLGERVHGMHEVAGSSPAGSTPHVDGNERQAAVGANEFRRLFGYWMERAAAGEEILITRRGRRYARLGPPDPQLDVPSGDSDAVSESG